jgi:hypothetical protein
LPIADSWWTGEEVAAPLFQSTRHAGAIGNENLVLAWGRNPRCHPEPAALGGGIRMTLTPFGTLRLGFFSQPTR